MVQKNNFTLRLDDAKRQRVDRLALEFDRSRAWVMQRALDEYLDRQDVLRSEMEQAAARPPDEPAIDHDSLMLALEKLIGRKR
jgi:hypothetical protein